MNTQIEYKDALALAVQASLEARSVLLKYFLSDLIVEEKPDLSPVTLADKKAEEQIRTFFQKHTPNFGLIGEEFGTQTGSSDWQWTIDPLDGTKAFIHGCPLFGTLIALLYKGEPVVGVINMPAINWTVSAYAGGPCIWNGKEVHVSKITQITDAFLCDGSITTLENKGYGKGWRSLRSQAKLHRGWGDCYGYALVALGKAEAMFDPIVSTWDVAPMPVILKAAGGVFSDIHGVPDITSGTGLATNGHIHTQILSELKLF